MFEVQIVQRRFSSLIATTAIYKRVPRPTVPMEVTIKIDRPRLQSLPDHLLQPVDLRVQALRGV